MRNTDFSKFFRISVIFVLIAAMALCIVSCGGSKGDNKSPITETEETTGEEVTCSLTITVVDDKGESKVFKIKTDADNLGDALLEANLVEGENGAYGLYIKSVNGLRADYELDGAYWSLSKDGEMLMTGASDTPIADGEKYELTYTK